MNTNTMRYKSADLPNDPQELKNLLINTLDEVKALKEENNSMGS